MTQRTAFIQTPGDPPTRRSHEDMHLLMNIAGQILGETADTLETMYGDWLFVTRLGRTVPLFGRALWTTVAGIIPERAARPDWVPKLVPPALVVPQLDTVRISGRDADTFERIAGFDGAGIALCLDQHGPENADLIRETDAMFGTSGAETTGPMLWYGQPPRPPRACAGNGGRP